MKAKKTAKRKYGHFHDKDVRDMIRETKRLAWKDCIQNSRRIGDTLHPNISNLEEKICSCKCTSWRVPKGILSARCDECGKIPESVLRLGGNSSSNTTKPKPEGKEVDCLPEMFMEKQCAKRLARVVRNKDSTKIQGYFDNKYFAKPNPEGKEVDYMSALKNFIKNSFSDDGDKGMEKETVRLAKKNCQQAAESMRNKCVAELERRLKNTIIFDELASIEAIAAIKNIK